MNNPFDYTPSAACDEAFRQLTARIESFKASDSPADINLCRELEAGKMIGVLIASDTQGDSHTLYAFSGQLGNQGFYHEGFVGPVFDYLQPDGYFKTKEAEISSQNIEIALFEDDTFAITKRDYELTKEQLDNQLAEYKEQCRLSKYDRDTRRQSGTPDEAELAVMIRQSQYEKAELKRLKKKSAAILEPLLTDMLNAQAHLQALKEKRRADSEGLHKWLFTNFKLLNALGESKSLSEIFAPTSMKIPPSGAGECCAPKLLQACYQHGWQPVSMAEYWYGKPRAGEVRIHGQHYPACRGKCLPVLTWMLQGLSTNPPINNENYATASYHEPEIIYENQWFCVIDKPSGMLSAPGKGSAVSLQQWLEERYGTECCVKIAHRLDQDTSGLIIATFGQQTFKIMQTLFATRKVKKTYAAVLDGDYRALGLPQQGHLELPLSPDWLDRPRQRIDLKEGKTAITDYNFTATEDGRSRVIFYPHTGRTHQLRVHAASAMGLGMPITGDRLYGKNSSHTTERLHLHAHHIEFTFPIDGQHYHFTSPIPF